MDYDYDYRFLEESLMATPALERILVAAVGVTGNIFSGSGSCNKILGDSPGPSGI